MRSINIPQPQNATETPTVFATRVAEAAIRNALYEVQEAHYSSEKDTAALRAVDPTGASPETMAAIAKTATLRDHVTTALWAQAIRDEVPLDVRRILQSFEVEDAMFLTKALETALDQALTNHQAAFESDPLSSTTAQAEAEWHRTLLQVTRLRFQIPSHLIRDFYPRHPQAPPVQARPTTGTGACRNCGSTGPLASPGGALCPLCFSQVLEAALDLV